MEELLNHLKTRITILEQAIKRAEKDAGSFPCGHLRVSTSRNRCRYYQLTEPGDLVGKYLTKDCLVHAKALAQKDYNEQFLKEAQKELAALEKTLSKLAKSNSDLVYQKLSPAAKKLVNPYILPDDIYIEEWLSESFKPNPYMPESRIYDTKRGDMVRSKSEAIIADMLLDLGIPYHYEKPIRLKGGAKRYPDFTLLKVAAREEVYLEHFGLLDDEDYRADFPLDIKGFRKMLSDLLI